MRAVLSAVVLFWVTMVEGLAMEHVPDGIHKDGVGRVTLGQPVPKDLIPKDAAERYIGGYHADFQAHDAFRLDTPPVTVFLDRGPFQRASRKKVVDPSEVQGLASRAVRDLRGAAKVRMIVVENAVVRTAAGVGVGSDLGALRSAYPDLRSWPVPPTFGGDECVAVTAALPSVHFHFKDCKAAEEGALVVRVILFRE